MQSERQDFWRVVMRGVLTALIVAAVLAIPFTRLVDWTARKISARPAIPPVGTVIASLLPPAQFGTEIEGTWVPVEGQPVPKDSRYYELTKRENLPDLRGVFLRALNEFTPGKTRADEYMDPEGAGRTPGHLQPDDVKPHAHRFKVYMSNGRRDLGRG
jgi:hypothetical protein